MDKLPPTVFVAGLGRCGTSLLMQMLDAGGMAVYPDKGWPAYEYGDYFQTGGSPEWLKGVSGKASKLLDPHKLHWSLKSFPYKVIWLSRDTAQQAASQIKFLRASMPFVPDTRQARKGFEWSIRKETKDAMALLKRLGANVLRMNFEHLLANPIEAATTIQEHIRADLDLIAMATAVRSRSADCYPGFLEAELLKEPA